MNRIQGFTLAAAFLIIIVVVTMMALPEVVLAQEDGSDTPPADAIFLDNADEMGLTSLAIPCPAGAGDVAALRLAIQQANSSPATADTILLAPNCTYSVSDVDNTTADGANGLPSVTSPLTIRGQGAVIARSTSSTMDFRLIHVAPSGVLTLTAMTVRNGRLPIANSGGGIKVLGRLVAVGVRIRSNYGGGINNTGGGLKLSSVTIAYNAGGYGITNQGAASLVFDGGNVSNNLGGGIYNASSNASLAGLTIIANTGGGGVYNSGSVLTKLSLGNSLIMSNTATSGGGIYNSGTGAVATIANSQIASNTVSVSGGGIFNNGVLSIMGSTIDHNYARSGGGIENFGGSLALTNATVSDNGASDNGGGIYVLGNAVFVHVTIAANRAHGNGGNLFNDEAQVSFASSIVANALAGGNCFNSAGNITSVGYNLESANTCKFTATGDLVNTDPLLNPLNSNGGATMTRGVAAGSPAIDKVPPSVNGCGAMYKKDQRGAARPQGVGCDSGSYETGPAPVITIVKDVQPGSVTNFAFTGDLGAFALDDPVIDDGDAFTQSRTFIVAPGLYSVAEGLFPSFVLSSIACDPASRVAVTPLTRSVQISAVEGDAITCIFTNLRRGAIISGKFNDLDQNHLRGASEPWLNGWTLRLFKSPTTLVATAVTTATVIGGVPATGRVIFGNLAPGSYAICEEPQPGWQNTRPAKTNTNYGNRPCFSLKLDAGKVINVAFGNTTLVVTDVAAEGDETYAVAELTPVGQVDYGAESAPEGVLPAVFDAPAVFFMPQIVK